MAIKQYIHIIYYTVPHKHVQLLCVNEKRYICIFKHIYIFKNDFKVEKYDNWTENLLSLLTPDTEQRM